MTIKDITIFKNIKDTEQPFFRNVEFILDRIKNGRTKELIKRKRSEKDKTKINELKQQHPAI